MILSLSLELLTDSSLYPCVWQSDCHMTTAQLILLTDGLTKEINT